MPASELQFQKHIADFLNRKHRPQVARYFLHCLEKHAPPIKER